MTNKLILYLIAIILLLLVSNLPVFAAQDWQKVSDEQIARVLFNKEKLYFQPDTKCLVDEFGSMEGVVVHQIKRLMANLDDNPKEEMAVLVVYSTGMCTFCVDNTVIAILDKYDETVNVKWKMDDRLTFNGDDRAGISTVKLFKKDKFFGLICTYDKVPIETGSSYKDMSIIRWNGKKYSEVWNYTIESHDTGGRGGVPHDYQAKVEFSEDKIGIKKIKVSGIYTTRSYSQEQPVTEHEVKEEFVWDGEKQQYISTTKKPK